MRGVIKVIRPAWVIGENVPQFVSMGGIDNVIDDLENLGYSAQPFIVPACAVGAWHQRERVWIVAHADRKRKQQSQGQLAQGGRWCGNIHTPGNDVPDSAGGGCQRGGQTRQWIMEAARSGEASPDVPDAVRAGREKLDVASVTERQAEGILWDDPVGPAQQRHACWDADFGDVLRMADGVSEGLDSRERNARIRALGNAIVPQVVAPFFRWIAQIERGVMSNV
jgi:DNA (cytosine-5)-methyltransferase 1